MDSLKYLLNLLSFRYFKIDQLRSSVRATYIASAEKTYSRDVFSIVEEVFTREACFPVDLFDLTSENPLKHFIW